MSMRLYGAFRKRPWCQLARRGPHNRPKMPRRRLRAGPWVDSEVGLEWFEVARTAAFDGSDIRSMVSGIKVFDCPRIILSIGARLP